MRHLQGTEEALNIWYGSCVLLCAVLQKAKLQEHCAEGILMQIPSFSSDAVDSNSRLFFLVCFMFVCLFCFVLFCQHQHASPLMALLFFVGTLFQLHGENQTASQRDQQSPIN